MLKDIKVQLMKVLRSKWVPLVALLGILIGLYVYSKDKYRITDRMTTGTNSITSSSENKNLLNPSMDTNTNQTSLTTVANANDLLPRDTNSQWASLNPIGTGNIAIPDLLESGHHIGLDTIGQSFKNPNYQNRPDPIIQKVNTGPWSQSSIEPDYGRAPF